MTTPEPRPRARAAGAVGRVLAGLVSAAVGIVFLLCVWVVVSSRFGITEQDVHGYGLIFGCILGIVAALVVAVILPLAFPHRRRSQLYVVTMSSFAGAFVLLIALVVTA